MKKEKVAVKRLKSNTEKKEPEKKWAWFDYTNMFTGLETPMSEKGLRRLGEELMHWAYNDPEAFKISQFYLAKGINRTTWQSWCAQYDFFSQSCDFAKQIIGNRREMGAINNKLNLGIVSYTMPFYDPEWKEETVRRASLKEGSGEAKSTVVVTMNPIPSSSIVPERKKDG